MDFLLHQFSFHLLYFFSLSMAFGQSLTSGFPLGGADGDRSHDIVADASGNTFVTGFFSNSVDFDPGPGALNLISNGGAGDIFLAKYDASSSLEWAIAIGSTGYDVGNAIDLDANGNIYVTGRFEGTVDFDPSANTFNLISNGGPEIFVAAYKSDGSFLWANAMGGSFNDEGFSIKVFDNTHLYVCGRFQATADFDPGPAVLNLVSAGSDDIFFMQFDINGSFQWANRIGSTNFDTANEIALGAGSQIYLTGTFTGTVDFDPSAATASLTSTGFTDVFVAQYDKNGNYQWAFKLGGTGFFGNEGKALAIDGAGIYITGRFSGTADFDPSANTANLAAGGLQSVFFAAYTLSGTYRWAHKIS